MSELVIDGFAGPGGWEEAARRLGIAPVVGFEIDAAACATRAAAGHLTIRCDLSRYPAEALRGRVRGSIWSPVCITFSAAGKRGGVVLIDILGASIRDAMRGRKSRAARRREMASVLRSAGWASPKLTRAQRSAAIWKAVRSASLVVEPARFIHACRPEWVAMEQVPSVLPLWQVYAEELRSMGYSTWCGVLNAADYGVPQTRLRAILIASRVRRVSRPEPTHYDPRKGMQLWGTPWVSMAEALSWGATMRPGPAVTAGGTAAGGAEPIARGGREALEAERDAGRWVLGGPYRSSPGDRTRPRGMDEPATTVAFGHSGMISPEDHPGVPEGDPETWVLHTNRDQREDGTRQTADPQTAPAPAPALTAKSGGQWVLHRNRGASVDRRDHPADEPAPTITSAGSKVGANLAWKFRNNNNNNACERSLDEPAGTLFFGGRSNWAAWVAERPATTVQGDPLAGRPGHKDREGGEAQFEQDSVRITPQEAALLQSFPSDYPWKGTKTKIFEQIGNAIPPLLAEHVLAMATGVARSDVAA